MNRMGRSVGPVKSHSMNGKWAFVKLSFSGREKNRLCRYNSGGKIFSSITLSKSQKESMFT